MCGRFALLLSPDQLARQFDLPFVDELIPRYNIAPGQPIAVVRSGPDGGRELKAMHWGLQPSWADPAQGAKLINARAESVHQKPSFRSAFVRRRAIIPASGFFEWKAPAEAGVKKAPKTPYYITVEGMEVLPLAGLWEQRLDKSAGKEQLSCTILTREASTAMRPIHERMPVILPFAAVDRWLDPAQQNAEALQHIFGEAVLDGFRFQEISRRINNPAHEGPEALAPPAADDYR